MSIFNTAGNPRAHRVRLYYEGTSTIYQGMPLFYTFDTTTNWFGGSVSNGAVTASTTTAEGSQNEGKYIRVQDPDADNGHAFAGVVAPGGWVGKSGPRALDVYIPNGAIVPVRAGCACTVGKTVLGVVSGGSDFDTTGRPVALAAETVDRSSTSGLVLAVLDPGMFLWQTGDAAALVYDDQNATTTVIMNQIYVTESQTANSFVPLYIHHTSDGNTSAALNEYNILSYLNLSGTYDQAGYVRGILSQLNLSGTIDGAQHVAAGMVQLSGAPTLTDWEHISCLWVDSAMTGIDNGGDPPSASSLAGNLSLVKLSNNGGSEDIIGDVFYIYGGYGIDKLFKFDTCINGGGADEHFISDGGAGGAEKGIATTSGWKKVKCDIDGTSYYLILYHTPTEVDMVS